MDKIVESIIRLFDRVECPVSVIMRTPKAGEEVDNGYGMDFELPPYAVIHRGDILECEVSYKIYRWQRKCKIELLKFDEENCENIDLFIQELNETDGYEVVWKRE